MGMPVNVTFLNTRHSTYAKDLVCAGSERLRERFPRLHQVDAVVDWPAQSTRKAGVYQIHLVMHVDGLKEVAVSHRLTEEDAQHLDRALTHVFDTAQQRLHRLLARQSKRRQARRQTPSRISPPAGTA